MSREACRYLETRARSLSFARSHRINKHWRADAQHPPLYSGLNIRWGGLAHTHPLTQWTRQRSFIHCITTSADRALFLGLYLLLLTSKEWQKPSLHANHEWKVQTGEFQLLTGSQSSQLNTQAPVKDRLNGFSVRGPRPGVRCSSVFMWKHTCACATMRIKGLLTLLLNTHWGNLGSRAGWISKFIQSARLGVSCGHQIAEDPIPRLTAWSKAHACAATQRTNLGDKFSRKGWSMEQRSGANR